MIKIRYLYPVIFIFLFASCDTSSPKVDDPVLLGNKIFELIKKGDSKKLGSYLITKKEVEKAFEKSIINVTLSDKERKQFFTDVFERNNRDAQRFINMYTSEEYVQEGVLKNAVSGNTAVEMKEEKGTTIARIVTYFSSGTGNYQLNLDAAKVTNYWKLLAWIEIRKL